MQSEQLIQSLVEQTRQIINQVEQLKKLDAEQLNFRTHEMSWSILECLEHLNLYGEFYLPEIEKSIQPSKSKWESEFKSGFLGSYFAKSMLPKAKMSKMKTFKDKNPINSKLDKTVIDHCIKQQIEILELLNQSRAISLNQVRIKTSIAAFIRLKLGDTFQFLINHNIRHLKQIETLKNIQKL